MSGTTVHSSKENKKEEPCVAGSITTFTERTVEVPENGQVYEEITSYIEEKGNMEIEAGDFEIGPDGVAKENGTTITVFSPEMMKTFAKYAEERKQQEELIKAISQKQSSKGKKATKVGIEHGE